MLYPIKPGRAPITKSKSLIKFSKTSLFETSLQSLSIFFDFNFISIIQKDNSNWDENVMDVKEFIRSFIQDDNTILYKENFIKKSNLRRYVSDALKFVARPSRDCENESKKRAPKCQIL